MNSFSITDKGNYREINEDNYGHASYLIKELFVVCDGMGGHNAGEVASEIAINSIIEFFSENNSSSKSNKEIILQAISSANKRVFDKSLINKEHKGMGTTVVVLVIEGNKAYWGHAGDSRIYMLRQGELKRLTKDHSFVQFLVDKGIITDVEAESHPRKNEITTAIGIEENIEAETCASPLELIKGDKLLLCSDGLNSMINDNEIAKILNNSTFNLEQQSKKLVEAALNAGGYDNITVQLIEI